MSEAPSLMRRRDAGLRLLRGLLCGLTFAACGVLLAQETQTTKKPDAPSPVLLELFTSQGCSSCPPAERLFSRLGRSATPGTIVPLACHVEYWNHLGWRDLFSLKLCSARQEAYAGLLDAGGEVYTPQLVIDGREPCHGADERCITAAIAAAQSRTPVARLSLSTSQPDARLRRLHVRIKAELLQPLPDVPQLEVVAVLFENNLETKVLRGENAGRTLNNDFVVRRMEPVFSMETQQGSTHEGDWTVELDRQWNVAELGIAAFLHNPDSMDVFAASAEPLGSPTEIRASSGQQAAGQGG